MSAWIESFFAVLAYSPLKVYFGVVMFMLASGLGLPIPEEVVLISAGFAAFIAHHPDLYPPPSVDATPINVYILGAVALFAVLSSDYLIFYLGRRFGPKILRWKIFSRMANSGMLERVQGWVKKYGYLASVVFRFTPGIRFPGHLMCGAMGLSPYRFLAVDLIAAGLTVPTQIWLVAFYGKDILGYFRKFKMILLGVLALIAIYFLIKKIYEHYSLKKTKT